ncbi:MAG: hypothetical protein WDZ89_03845, partial [Gemmatimonadota bacterium]
MKMRMVVALLALVFGAPAFGMQAAGAQEAPTASPPVPQTFDWHRSTPIPATTPWGQAIDTASTRLIRSWT